MVSNGYRPEIDGLRAIAVLSVVFYHFDVAGIGGGFVGVDIFFVISGFLIGGLLWSELDQTGRVSLRRFYLRRFKRLAPAFFTMALVVSAVAWQVLLPFEYREFGKSLIAATVYLSNVQFYREAGYFDAAAEEKPMLHTWSLAVEEQFYLFLPLLILLIGRRRWLSPILQGVFVLSLLACVSFTPTNPTATFFLFPFRAWELLAGVLLAIWGYKTRSDWALHPLLSFAGMALLVYAVVFVQSGPGFPGAWALIPTLGTVLILLNGQDDNVVNRLLRSGPVVFVGLISYSLYLWHWPVAVLSKYVRETYAGPAESAAWMALSLLLAVVSWRFVERPTRHAARLGFPTTIMGVGLLSLVTLGIGGAAFKADGFPGRFPADIRSHIDASADFLQDWSRCNVAESGPLAGVETCAIGPAGDPQVLFWGDSHLRALMDGIGAMADQRQVPGLIIWHAGCPPVFGVEKRENSATPVQDLACTTANASIRAALPDMGLRDIVLIGRWSYYVDGTGVGVDAENKIILLPETGSQADRLRDLLSRTVDEVGTYAKVHILRQIPEIPFYDSRITARRLAHGRSDGLSEVFSVPLSEVDARQARSDVMIAEIAGAENATLLDPRPYLCNALRCSIWAGEEVVYFDNNHLTNTGAARVAPVFASVFNGAAE
ncbi:O-acetyltransferase OatA [Thalassovita gelatinovora]|uniref:O-acetyltransferase OatA n=1 Tax=Thalassovita gelatinovora TaxID=53501 RepID=A0A0P1FY42_THAGE|nr:acyltransferase family protein [Thalassovita gelatinovora]QIZ81169.1 acyltransferase [Thalassovita gelatinovora]CUH64780.1 O-acetyltransferase OatA [Thalassovita gelatinovora]SEP92166.1 Peptidoglycan/LPS O-acetylase OafA/YrhL, contains acyltransferase and SGNH-hydrolase domains [Thalassovita gelatinovora]